MSFAVASMVSAETLCPVFSTKAPICVAMFSALWSSVATSPIASWNMQLSTPAMPSSEKLGVAVTAAGLKPEAHSNIT